MRVGGEAHAEFDVLVATHHVGQLGDLDGAIDVLGGGQRGAVAGTATARYDRGVTLLLTYVAVDVSWGHVAELVAATRAVVAPARLDVRSEP
jgi:hypothetical protein